MKIVKKTIENDEKFLRSISKPVDLTNDDYKKIVNELKNYCNNSEKALALASVQLGVPLRLIYVKKTDLKRLEDDYDESKVLINPVIKKREGKVLYWETCASCLDYMGLVERPYKLILEYFDIEKNKYNEEFVGFPAVVLSHEMDHLDGILHIDKSLEIYNMSYEDRKIFRETHKYEIIREKGVFKPSRKKFKRFER